LNKPKKKSVKENKSPLPKLIVIVGPTASGKSDLAIKIAKRFDGQIVSADSRQIYRGLNIGTAKPTKLERQEVKHYLIDIKNPDQPFDAAAYQKEALRAIKKIIAAGKIPILVGGTGLYIASVTENLRFPKVKPNPSLRQKLNQELKQKGINYLYQKLIRLDPEAAYIVDPNNPRRVIRALEITLGTKKPFSASRRRGKPLFDCLQIGINRPKEELKKRINRRIEAMVKEGLVAEVKNLIKKYPAGLNAFEAIGYREIIDYLQGKTSLEEAIELMKQNTWRYAKRQMTWFKKNKNIIWLADPKKAFPIIRGFLSPAV
jgi:tRNA dimethylallyltransferase